ncbi:alcohol dehydrogenase [Mycetocola zhadangensis]|nr:alcohol dehydrogenase [Mycetocola zhadangensis]
MSDGIGRDVLVTPSPVAMVWQGEGRPHEALAVPGVSLAPGELLVEVELATVCGSDVHTVLGHRHAPTPLVLGHEQVGRVTAVGEGAVASDGTPLIVGMRVVWSVTVSCGSCDRCSRGLAEKCRALAKYGHDRVHRGWELSGGFATHVQVRAGSTVVLVDEALPAAVAAPASCATATVAAALEAAADRVRLAGATVVVLGAGLLGITATAMATDAGARVVVSDPDPLRRSAALSFGAAAVADSRSGFRSATGLGGVLATLTASGAAEPLIVLEMSGSTAAVSTAMNLVGVGGVIVLVGSVSPSDGIRLDPETLVRGLITVRGVHNYAARHLISAVDYLEHAWYRYPFAQLVGNTFPLALVDDALALAATGTHQRVALDPHLGA